MLGLTAGLISLIIFGNIENLILASQGVVKGANPVKLGILSVIIVICWLLIGTFGTQLLESYGIFILGLQSMMAALKGE